ncbi:unnamed protein product [Amoebophrya sp. A120]|nr:unnamed protein product [Amoebophrya sp. A120]|eukprot:GSA120T00017139001.1
MTTSPPTNPNPPVTAAPKSPVAEEKLCRYCFDDETAGPLIDPCNCAGGQKWVHLECLRRWQRTVLVTQPTHPAFYDRDLRHQTCNVCKAAFTCPPPTRHELMQSFTGGELAALIQEKSVIVAHKSFCDELEKELRGIPAALRARLNLGHEHWINAVMLITKVEEPERSQDIPVPSRHAMIGMCRLLIDKNGKPLFPELQAGRGGAPPVMPNYFGELEDEFEGLPGDIEFVTDEESSSSSSDLDDSENRFLARSARRKKEEKADENGGEKNIGNSSGVEQEKSKRSADGIIKDAAGATNRAASAAGDDANAAQNDNFVDPPDVKNTGAPVVAASTSKAVEKKSMELDDVDEESNLMTAVKEFEKDVESAAAAGDEEDEDEDGPSPKAARTDTAKGVGSASGRVAGGAATRTSTTSRQDTSAVEVLGPEYGPALPPHLEQQDVEMVKADDEEGQQQVVSSSSSSSSGNAKADKSNPTAGTGAATSSASASSSKKPPNDTKTSPRMVSLIPSRPMKFSEPIFVKRHAGNFRHRVESINNIPTHQVDFKELIYGVAGDEKDVDHMNTKRAAGAASVSESSKAAVLNSSSSSSSSAASSLTAFPTGAPFKPQVIKLLLDEDVTCGEDHVVAVNLSRKLPRPMIPRVFERELSKVQFKKAIDKVTIQHYIGGPCDEDEIRACIILGGVGCGWTVFSGENALSAAVETAYTRAVKRSEAEGEIRGGQVVRLQGLKSCPELNGESGIALRFHSSSGRWLVRLANGEGKSLKPENLVCAESSGSAVTTRSASATSSSSSSSSNCAVEAAVGATAAQAGAVAHAVVGAVAAGAAASATNEKGQDGADAVVPADAPAAKDAAPEVNADDADVTMTPADCTSATASTMLSTTTTSTVTESVASTSTKMTKVGTTGTVDKLLSPTSPSEEVDLQQAAAKQLSQQPSFKPVIFCIWGDARWSRTQLLGEIARGSWGLCHGNVSDFSTTAVDRWKNTEGRCVYAPLSEMSEDYMKNAERDMALARVRVQMQQQSAGALENTTGNEESSQQ